MPNVFSSTFSLLQQKTEIAEHLKSGNFFNHDIGHCYFIQLNCTLIALSKLSVSGKIIIETDCTKSVWMFP